MIDDGSGIDPRTVVNLFNTPIFTWLFQKIFDTHKILRSDIEKLPIYTDFIGNVSESDEEELLSYLNVERVKDGNYRIKK